MKLRFWGVRGSISVPGPDTVQFGGNTSCLQICEDNQPIIILDAGTGIRKLGLDILTNHKDKKDIHLLLSHTHWDHIQGLPFFAPLYIPGYSVSIYGPVHYEKSLEQILDRQMEYTYFPVRVAELAAKISYHGLKEDTFKIGGITVRTKYLNHPVLCLGYRFEHGGKSITYCTDHEPYFNLFGETGVEDEEVKEVVAEQNRVFFDFIRGSDLLVLDTQYTETEYPNRVGWGHGYTTHNMEIVSQCNIKRWALFHHDPDRSDAAQKKIEEALQEKGRAAKLDTEIFAAKEGMIIEV
jgi:phosphoribosyl 1,2-cyclic phosphodiesterase